MADTKIKTEKAIEPEPEAETKLVGPGRLQAIQDIFDGERIISGPKGDRPGEVFDSNVAMSAELASAVDPETPLGIPYVPPPQPGDPRLHAPRPSWTTTGYVERAQRKNAQQG